MKKIIFKGGGTAIATPFDEQGVNLQEFAKLVELGIILFTIIYISLSICLIEKTVKNST